MINISKEAIVQEFQKLNIPAEKVAEGVNKVISHVNSNPAHNFVMNGTKTMGHAVYIGPSNFNDENICIETRSGRCYEKTHVDCLVFFVSENKICFASHDFDFYENTDEWHSDDYFTENEKLLELVPDTILEKYRF